MMASSLLNAMPMINLLALYAFPGDGKSVYMLLSIKIFKQHLPGT